ncbi:MAG: hypothetical protein JW971_08520 [Synergistales bacterium]|nr:hypothetical protein [Synergistales bacterium]
MPNHPEFEGYIWNVIKGRHIRFWPSLFLDREIIIADIENRFPVKMKLTLKGFGSPLFQAEPLRIWSLIKWKDQDWFLEPGGLIWRTSDRGNVIVDVPDINDIPCWKIGATIGPPFHEGEEIEPGTDSMIRTSNLPVTRMIEWWREIVSLSWADLIYQVEINRVAAEYELTFSIVAGATRVFLKVKAEEQNWLELNDAIRQIMPDFPFMGKNMEIDATFRNRIVVREL